MIKLYGYWRSTAAYRVRIALNIKQVSYSQESVHLVKGGGEQHKVEYKKLNPQALVPTLVDDNFVIGQSMAILEYLEEKYPAQNLLPKDLMKRSLTRQLCQVIASDLHPLNNLRVLQYLSNQFKVEESQKSEWYHHWLAVGFDAFEKLLDQNELNGYVEKGKYCMGRELSMADVCLIPQVYNANRFDFSLDAYPRVKQINQNCLELGFFQDAIPENQPDAV